MDQAVKSQEAVLRSIRTRLCKSGKAVPICIITHPCQNKKSCLSKRVSFITILTVTMLINIGKNTEETNF